MIIENIEGFLSGSNVLFHYTKRNTVLQYILKDKTLKFSKRKKTNDAFERGVFGIETTDSQFEFIFNTKSDFQLNEVDSKRLSSEIFHIINYETTQLSFCQNDVKSIKKDYFGFLKPRMWAQYGDNYKGICLAFDKEILMKELRSQFSNDVFFDDISYKSFSEMEDRTGISININSKNEATYQYFYEKSLVESINKMLFTKHMDYEHENEFRVINISKNQTFSFNNSIKAVIINLQYFMTTKIKEITTICETLDIPLIIISWNYRNIVFFQIK